MKRSPKRTTAIAPRRDALRTIAMAHELRSAALARVIEAFVGAINRRIDRAMARVVNWMNRHPAWT
ncbi:hypothetical protein [Denitromonas iodatirespirans]|uniref:Uncharacterized protein n=1 Tax=Denitromonas iodatirespirans TaxID=2795389 RepID=A0A944DJY9_DENI1|nr:hypothetical protein [Denitromonas iodatirespirans]MBT0960184.1 hypothetical protein [Denitromonas iodatirespirans]